MRQVGRTGRFFIAMLLASVSPALFATPPRSPISLTLNVEGLEQGDLSGAALLEVVSVQDAPGTTVTLILPAGMRAERTEWTVDLLADVPIRLTTQWSLSAGPGNYTVSAKAIRAIGHGSSWGDMTSIPYHVESAGVPAARWTVDHVPLAKSITAGTALMMPETPLPFAFEDLSTVSGAEESWPATAALPPLPEDDAGPAAVASPGAPSPAGAPAPAGTVTLTGTWQYPDRSGVARPVDQQYIEIRHGDGTALSPRVFCFTQTSGAFSCPLSHPGTTMRVWLRSATNLTPGPTRLGVFSGIEVPGGCGSDAIDCTYVNTSPAISCPDGGTCSLGVMVAAGGEPWIGAHQMTQDLVRSWKKILFDTKHPAGTHSGPAKITYPTPTGHGPHAHVFNGGSETTGDPWISIPAPYQTAADVVAHEYGHAVMDNLWHSFTPNWAQDDCPSGHALGSPSGYGCALSEGFADFWSWYSNELYDGDDDPDNNGPIYNDPGFSSNFETRDDGTYQRGDRVEGNVAGAFGDLLDAVNEGPPACVGAADRVSDGIQHIWHVLQAESSATYLDWFTKYGSVYLHPLAPLLETSSLNRIDYGFLANPTCAGAMEMPGLKFNDVADTSLDTCPDPTAPTPTCGNGSNAKSVFYHWTAPADGTVTVDTFGSAYDTILSAWAGACGALVSRGCNDDASGTQSQLVLPVSSGDSLTFMVSAYHGDGGDLLFQFEFAPQAAQNDLCAAPTVIGITPYADIVDVTTATTSAGDPAHTCAFATPGRSVFYRWTAPADGIVTADTAGSNYDTLLSAYTGACGALTEIACSDDEQEFGWTSTVTLPVTMGTTLTFMVSDQFGSSQPWLAFNLDFTTPAPSHDACTAAVVVTSVPFTHVSNSYGAGTSPGDPAPGCGNLSRARNVWYEYTPPGDGTITADTLGSAYDTILSAWTGACGSMAAVAGGCNDDHQPPNQTSLLQVPVTGGVPYRFQVSAYAGDGGATTFNLAYAPWPPQNDLCDGATIVTGYPWQAAAYTAAATTDPGEPASPCGNGSAALSVWYRFTAPASGLLEADTFGSAYDTILSVWSGGCGTLVAEACNDDAPGSAQSSLTVPVAKGVTYRIRVSSYTGTGGVTGFSLQFFPASGHVPDGSLYPGQALSVSLTPGGDVSLAWGPSCLGTDTDYIVYEGRLGNFYSHVPVFCGTGGALSAIVRPATDDTYYIVVPRNASREGSHGLTSAGAERPAGPGMCLPQAIAGCAPACAHDICAVGGPLEPACSDCVAAICAQSPDCCSSAWSADCADYAQRFCPQECN